MKYCLVLIVVLLFSESFSQNVTSSEEQDAIKKVVVDETKFFYARNAAKWADCYRQTNQTYWACIEKGESLQQEGWDHIAPFVVNYIKNNPKPIKGTFKRENYNFRKVNPTYIWLTFDQTRTTAGKKDFSKETRIMELIKGEWKIVSMIGFWMPNDKVAKPETIIIPKEKKKSESSEQEGSLEEKKKVQNTRKNL